MGSIHPLRRWPRVLLAWLMAWGLLSAQGLRPSAVLAGRLRNFSPNGRYAVAQDGAHLKVYETATWKASGPLATQGEPLDRFDSICVDDDGRVAAFRAQELQVYDFAGSPRLLFTIPNSATSLAYPFVADGRLLVRIVQVPRRPTSKDVLEYTKVVFVVKTKFHQPYYRYRIAPFSVPLSALVEACERNGAASLQGPEALEGLRRMAVRDLRERQVEDNCSDTDRGSEATVQRIECTDGIWRFGITHLEITHRSCEPGSVSECIRWERRWVFLDGFAPKTDFKRITGGTYDYTQVRHTAQAFDLQECRLEPSRGGAWQAVPRGRDPLPPFDLDFVPAQVSADGRWTAARPVPPEGSKGWTTAVYASEVVADPFTGYAPEVLQDLLLAKIIGCLKAKTPATALPYFRRLERIGIEQPQSFYYYRMKTLEDVGRKAEARAEAEAYLRRHGKAGDFYSEVIALLGRLQG